MKAIIIRKGGPTSGFRGHAGRPGKVGGSASQGYEAYSHNLGVAPKERRGKLSGKHFSFSGHRYEIIQSIPSQESPDYKRLYGGAIAILHVYDTAGKRDHTFMLVDTGEVRFDGQKVEGKFPFKFENIK